MPCSFLLSQVLVCMCKQEEQGRLNWGTVQSCSQSASDRTGIKNGTETPIRFTGEPEGLRKVLNEFFKNITGPWGNQIFTAV